MYIVKSPRFKYAIDFKLSITQILNIQFRVRRNQYEVCVHLSAIPLCLAQSTLTCFILRVNTDLFDKYQMPISKSNKMAYEH